MLKDWIPVTEPTIELPKDRVLYVTVDNGDELYVTKLYYDYTEWSDEDIVEYVIAYMDYSYPEPYKP